MPILMRSGVVEREMITWKMSHCRSPRTKISLESHDGEGEVGGGGGRKEGGGDKDK